MKLHIDLNAHRYSKYCIAGKFGGDKVWRIDSFRVFGKRKFGE